MMKYTQIPVNTFEQLQLNAGILIDDFDPTDGTIGNLLGATTGGITFASNPSFSDFGEDIDNCPPNMMELKRLDNFDPSVSGTFLTCTPAMVKDLLGAADADSVRIVPRVELETSDYHDLWWVGDYSNKNTGENAGFLAIHLMNALNTSGFGISSSKDGKGQMSFEYHAHYSIEDQETVPFEIYCRAGGDSAIPSINLNRHYATVAVGESITLKATVKNSSQTVDWDSSDSDVASVVDGVVTGETVGSVVISATITDAGVDYDDTCTVVVVAGT